MSPLSSESTKSRIGIFLILAIGSGLFIFHIDHAIQDRESPVTFFSGILIPMLLAFGVFSGGIWLWRQQRNGEYILRVAGWCALATFVLSGEAWLMALYQQGEGVIMSHRRYVFANAASGGAMVGLILGIYDCRQRAAQRESTRLSRHLTVLNRVLRHDIRNNVNVIHGRAELLADDSADTVEQAQKIQEKSADLVEISEHARDIEQLLQGDEPDIKTVDIVSLVKTSCERTSQDYPNAVFDVSLPEKITIYAHPLIDSALRNVIENAVKHNNKETPKVTVESRNISHSTGDSVEIHISDNGPGIPAREREVLQRGYETPLEHTSGLGLWLVNWIVMKSDGQIRLEENNPTGSVISLQFNRA